ncbi:hypothetical protein R0K30_21130, partial [Bacillus sp. SIMBA_154]|uniref:hypothetical protein n=1 Tax=Bacillus sp. SIMBA_154 TaxID=3080859 RepID=UPI003979364D
TKLGYFIANSMKRIEIGLNQFFPKLGIKYTAGLNYIDFCNAFRSRDDYKMLLRDSFEFLEKNKITPWLDLEFIKNSHINFKSDYSEEILLLIGLAVNLKKELKI